MTQMDLLEGVRPVLDLTQCLFWVYGGEDTDRRETKPYEAENSLYTQEWLDEFLVFK